MKKGDQVGAFVVEAHLGGGGMAEVWLGRHLQLGRRVALKELTLTKADVRHRFFAEGRAQAQLRHPNVLPVHDVLMHGDIPVLVLDYVAGPPLDDVLAEIELSPGEAVSVGRAIARGVAAAHAAGIVHRDLKPSNVLMDLTVDGIVPKVADFGLAKVLAEPGLTRTGRVMGTPAYMSPEQARGERVDARSDVYALGTILYELVSGARPYAGASDAALIAAVAANDATPLASRRPDLPGIGELVAWCMAPDPADRPASAAAVVDALDRLGAEPLLSSRIAHLRRMTLPDEVTLPSLPAADPTADLAALAGDDTPSSPMGGVVATLAIAMVAGVFALVAVAAGLVAWVLWPETTWRVVDGPRRHTAAFHPVDGAVVEAVPGWVLADGADGRQVLAVGADGLTPLRRVDDAAAIAHTSGGTAIIDGDQPLAVFAGGFHEAPAPLDGAPLWNGHGAFAMDLQGTGWIAGPGGATTADFETGRAMWSADGRHLAARVDGAEGPELRVWGADAAAVDVPPFAGVSHIHWLDGDHLAVMLPGDDPDALARELVLVRVTEGQVVPLGPVLTGVAHARGVVAVVPEEVDTPDPGVVALSRAWTPDGGEAPALAVPVFPETLAWGVGGVWAAAWDDGAPALARLAPEPATFDGSGPVSLDGRIWPAPQGHCAAAAVRGKKAAERVSKYREVRASDRLLLVCGGAPRTWPVTGPLDAVWADDAQALAVLSDGGVWLGSPAPSKLPAKVADGADAIAFDGGLLRVTDGPAARWFSPEGRDAGRLAVFDDAEGAVRWGGSPTRVLAADRELVGDVALHTAWLDGGRLFLAEPAGVHILEF